jgi:hypothetical protein
MEAVLAIGDIIVGVDISFSKVSLVIGKIDRTKSNTTASSITQGM